MPSEKHITIRLKKQTAIKLLAVLDCDPIVSALDMQTDDNLQQLMDEIHESLNISRSDAVTISLISKRIWDTFKFHLKIKKLRNEFNKILNNYLLP